MAVLTAAAMVDWWAPKRVASMVALTAVLKVQTKVAQRAVHLVGMLAAHLAAK